MGDVVMEVGVVWLSYGKCSNGGGRGLVELWEM